MKADSNISSWSPAAFVYLDDLNAVFRTTLEVLLMFSVLLLMAVTSGFGFGVHKTEVK